MKLFLILLLLGFSLNLLAVIENVQLNWDNIQCQQDCANNLNKNFQKIKEVSEVTVNQQTGVATLKWQLNVPFNFRPIHEAYAKVGIHMIALRLKVSGTITQKGKQFLLVSSGDNSRFNLIGNITAKTHQYTAEKSPYNRPLTADLIKQFIQAEKDRSLVTIEGPILQPFQFPPLDLITENVSISQSKK